MFGLFKSRRQRRLDNNELECLKEVALDYADGNYGVTREYAVQCYNDYFELGAYKRNRSEATDAAVREIYANLQRGDIRTNYVPQWTRLDDDIPGKSFTLINPID
jgi:hypothetical protein